MLGLYSLNHYRMKQVLITCLLVIVSGCASLPTDVQRTESFALNETSDTALGSRVQPLVKQHPGKSGFYELSEGIDAYAARLLLVKAAQKSIDLQ